ncbi:MAG TPA: hypothetical protein VKU37_14765 [Verrucomicrobiae bacterium]|nr:hypothetical protein [Verrucomicrobiae bacterium]
MKNKLIVGGTILMLAAKSALGADPVSNDQGSHYDSGDYYYANELSIDGFGSASIGKYTIDHLSGARVRHNTRLGAGLGLNYFITRNIGIGADAYSENTTGVFVDNASGNLILRIPLGQCGLAPYVFGGGGRNFDALKTWFAQAGVGMEYRFTRNVGVFVDARGVLPDEAKYYGVGRLGVRFAF